MNSVNSKTSDPDRLLPYFSDKVNLKKSDKYVALSNIILCFTQKTIKKNTKTINFKYQVQRVMMNMNYLMGHFLYQIFKIILRISSKNM